MGLRKITVSSPSIRFPRVSCVYSVFILCILYTSVLAVASGSRFVYICVVLGPITKGITLTPCKREVNPFESILFTHPKDGVKNDTAVYLKTIFILAT